MKATRFESCVRASSSLSRPATLRATAAGEKSSMLSNVMSTLSSPSPVSVFGTANAARGFSAFIRLSKLSTSISSILRSSIGGSGSSRLPARSASTPITNGICTFFCALPTSTSYSMCTRGGRFFLMNFWLLCLATGLLLTSGFQMRTPAASGPAESVILIQASYQLGLRHAVRRQIAKDLEEILRDQPLRPTQQQRHRTRRLVALEVLADLVQRLDGVLAARDLAHCESPPRRRLGRPVTAGRDRGRGRRVGAVGAPARELGGQHLVDLGQVSDEQAEIRHLGRPNALGDVAEDRVQILERAPGGVGARLELLELGVRERGFDMRLLQHLAVLRRRELARGDAHVAQRDLAD